MTSMILPEQPAPIDRLPHRRRFASFYDVNLERIEIRYRDWGGTAHSITAVQPHPASDGRIAVAAKIDHSDGAIVAHASVTNRSDTAIRLATACFHIATGFDRTAQARFFKHG